MVNGIEVAPPGEDNGDEVVSAVRLVPEKNPFGNALLVRFTSRDDAVALGGIVKSEAQRRMAEADCWYVFRADRVANLLLVEE